MNISYNRGEGPLSSPQRSAVYANRMNWKRFVPVHSWILRCFSVEYIRRISHCNLIVVVHHTVLTRCWRVYCHCYDTRDDVDWVWGKSHAHTYLEPTNPTFILTSSVISSLVLMMIVSPYLCGRLCSRCSHTSLPTKSSQCPCRQFHFDPYGDHWHSDVSVSICITSNSRMDRV
jgi:hypothetical protein